MNDESRDARDDDSGPGDGSYARGPAEELAQLRREELVGHLTASVAHDFNNLLGIIAGASTLLASETRGNEPAARLVGEIDAAVYRASGLVRALLSRLRGRPAVAGPADLNEVLAELRPLVERLAGDDIEVRLELDRRACSPVVVQEAFENAVLNLVANARDAMPSGGQLTIATHDVAMEGQGPGSASSRYVAVVVNDTGSGMSSAVRDRAFGPPFTTKEMGRGSGLGLAAVRRFATESRGCVSVHSAEGLGTSVWIYVPCPAPQDARSDSQWESEPAPDSAV